jgi:hypothetical protein
VSNKRAETNFEVERAYNRNTVHVEFKKMKVIPAVIMATENISKSFRKYLSSLPEKPRHQML